jgi:hypothetical protein
MLPFISPKHASAAKTCFCFYPCAFKGGATKKQRRNAAGAQNGIEMLPEVIAAGWQLPAITAAAMDAWEARSAQSSAHSSRVPDLLHRREHGFLPSRKI